MTEETGIMEIRIDGMDDITGTELQRIIDAVSGDWDYEAWNFDTLGRIEFPSCTIGDAYEMTDSLYALPIDLQVRARLSVRWWTYDERDGGLEARMTWTAGDGMSRYVDVGPVNWVSKDDYGAAALYVRHSGDDVDFRLRDGGGDVILEYRLRLGLFRCMVREVEAQASKGGDE